MPVVCRPILLKCADTPNSSASHLIASGYPPWRKLRDESSIRDRDMVVNMNGRRLIAIAALGALLILDVGAAAHAADPTYPTGSFTPVQPSRYLLYNPNDDSDPYASFDIRRISLADDETAPEDLVTQIVPGDGRAAVTLPCYTPAPAGETSYGMVCFVSYDRAGTFHPEVRLTDEDGHTTTYMIGPLRVLADETAPTARLTSPKAKPRLRHHKSAWRVMRGVAYDSGIGLNYVQVVVLQKRRGWWWIYTGYRNRWRKGARTEWSTHRTFGPPGTQAAQRDNGTWSVLTKGLTMGRISVRVFVEDRNGNLLSRKLLAKATIKRR